MSSNPNYDSELCGKVPIHLINTVQPYPSKNYTCHAALESELNDDLNFALLSSNYTANAMVHLSNVLSTYRMRALIIDVPNFSRFSAGVSKPGVPPVIRVHAECIREEDFKSPPDTNADDVFRLLQPLHSKDRYEGTGTGLAITKMNIERHNGAIAMHSKGGKGTIFEWIVPKKH
jgi:hypothetical protein